jgi:hypothetical protein
MTLLVHNTTESIPNPTTSGCHGVNKCVHTSSTGYLWVYRRLHTSNICKYASGTPTGSYRGAHGQKLVRYCPFWGGLESIPIYVYTTDPRRLIRRGGHQSTSHDTGADTCANYYKVRQKHVHRVARAGTHGRTAAAVLPVPKPSCATAPAIPAVTKRHACMPLPNNLPEAVAQGTRRQELHSSLFVVVASSCHAAGRKIISIDL